MGSIFCPKMTFDKASEIWSMLNYDEVLRGFFRTLGMTNDFIKIADLPSESYKVSSSEMWNRRGLFFINMLLSDDLTWGQKCVVIDTMIRIMPGVFVAWGITNTCLNKLSKDELVSIAYFFSCLGVCLSNNCPDHPFSISWIESKEKQFFSNIHRIGDVVLNNEEVEMSYGELP